MDGIINLDKPAGITSAKALYRVRKFTGQRKSGHAGTLDPSATGVLLLCLGRATKLVERIMAQPKVYLAEARLDVTSATLDADVTLEPVAVAAVPAEKTVRAALVGLLGWTMQVPPAVSAVKIGGRPAYVRVRQGETVVIQPRPVRIDWIQLLNYCWPALTLRVCCGRGTYVRSVIRDIGVALSTGGCLTGLVRERVGVFEQAAAVSLADIEASPDPSGFVLPLEEARQQVESPCEIAPPKGAIASDG